MSNVSRANGTMTKTNPQRRLRLAALALFALALAIFTLLPASFNSALGKDYTMPETHIDAVVENTGNLNVKEERLFDLDGSFTCVWWIFDSLPDDNPLIVTGVRYKQQSKSVDYYGEPIVDVQLEEVPFQEEWRDYGGPGKNCYSVDYEENGIYVFFDATDALLSIEIDYTVTDAVAIYDDVAELYWQYVGSEWAVGSGSVTMTLTLPNPNGTLTELGDEVRAWGHGDLDGYVSLSEDGKQIIYSSPYVYSGDFAEARITFPRDWITNPSEAALSKHTGEDILDDILAEEESWARDANMKRAFWYFVYYLPYAIAIALLIFTIYAYARHGKKHRPTQRYEYWNDVPDRSVHPAVIGRIWRDGKQSSADLIATIMSLATRGATQLVPINVRGARRPEDSYAFQLAPNAFDDFNDPIDDETMRFFFGRIGRNRDMVTLSSIADFADDHPVSFDDGYSHWQNVVTKAANRIGIKEKESVKWGTRVKRIAVVAMIASFFLLGISASGGPIWLFLVSIASLIVGARMPRMTQRATDIYEKCRAFKKWLADIATLDDVPPEDTQLWGEFMVYAYLIGVADKTIDKLQQVRPGLFERDSSSSTVPWFVWYTSGSSSDSGIFGRHSFVERFEDRFDDVRRSAYSAAHPSSDGGGGGGGWSSGGGGGGGFSGGGGGGFGGGGGGAR